MKYILLSFTLIFGFGTVGCQSTSVKNIDSPVAVKAGVSEMSPAEALPLVEAAYSQFVDVRTPEEYESGHAVRTKNIPLDTLAASLDTLEKNEPVYLICRTGARSKAAAKILMDNGFKQAISIAGGTEAWKAAGLPMGDAPPPPVSMRLDEKTRNALLAALQDERRAKATYQAVLSKFPNSRPFVNIIEAEKKHESFLLPLFAKYGVAVPKNEFDPAAINVADSISEACNTGVAAENENIALYEGFFQFVKEPDIKDVFSRLQSASRENHLPAFTRCSEGGGGFGRGNGPPR